MAGVGFEYTKKRKDFGKHPNFTDSQLETVDILGNPKDAGQWVERILTTTEIACIPSQSEHYINTEPFLQESRGMLHTEGGWPREVNTKEFEEKQRYLRKQQNDPDFDPTVTELAKTIGTCVSQNNALDMYEEYFEGIETDHSMEPPTARTLTVFRDPDSNHDDTSTRTTTSICWHPDTENKLAVSYSVSQFQNMPDNMPLSSYIWDVNNPNEPDSKITPPSPLCCLVYSPKNSEYLVGGCYNGLIAFWDLRKGKDPSSLSVVSSSHHDPVYDIAWIQSRTGNDVCSVSTDGTIKWWDVRHLRQPTDSYSLSRESEQQDTNPTRFGASCLAYKSDAGANRFLMGTEQGVLLNVERKAKKDAKSSFRTLNTYGLVRGGHHGPIYSLERNPTNLKYLLSVGDWTARIWFEDLKTPIMSTRYDDAMLTSGCWSPQRPGVFFTTKMNGYIDVWDIFYKQNEPILPIKVGERGLSCITVHKDGRKLAVGAVDGTTTMLEVNRALYVEQANEKKVISLMLEREMKREKISEKKADREDKLRLAAKKQAEEKPAEDETLLTLTSEMEDEEKKRFQAEIVKLRAKMG